MSNTCNTSNSEDCINVYDPNNLISDEFHQPEHDSAYAPADPFNPKVFLRSIVRATYALQKLRIGVGNRTVAAFRTKLGLQPSQPESDNVDAERILKMYRASYSRITDGIKKDLIPRNIKIPEGEPISHFTELCLVSQYDDLLRDEERHFKLLSKTLLDFPIYTQFLQKVCGIGPAMAGVIISEVDIHKAEYSASLWKYAGLDVAEDGKARSRRKEHQVEIEYVSKDGTIEKRNSITFNPFLRTKLLGVVGTSFLRCKNEKYSDIYYSYKNRCKNRPDLADHTDRHIHYMAIRYMVKLFLIDLYEAWRTLEGLECRRPYHEAKLGIIHTPRASRGKPLYEHPVPSEINSAPTM